MDILTYLLPILVIAWIFFTKVARDTDIKNEKDREKESGKYTVKNIIREPDEKGTFQKQVREKLKSSAVYRNKANEDFSKYDQKEGEAETADESIDLGKLSDHEELRKAVLYSEILKRKYF